MKKFVNRLCRDLIKGKSNKNPVEKLSAPILHSESNLLIVKVFDEINGNRRKIIGFLRASIFEGEKYIQLDALSVHPNYHEQGVAKSMWETLLAYVKNTISVSHIQVSPHPYYDLPLYGNEEEPEPIPVSLLYEIYLSLGFSAVSEPLNKEKCDQLLFYVL